MSGQASANLDPGVVLGTLSFFSTVNGVSLVALSVVSFQGSLVSGPPADFAKITRCHRSISRHQTQWLKGTAAVIGQSPSPIY